MSSALKEQRDDNGNHKLTIVQTRRMLPFAVATSYGQLGSQNKAQGFLDDFMTSTIRAGDIMT